MAGSIKIYEASNYDRFELLPFNRNVVRLKALIESMKKYGWINSRPMDVIAGPNGQLMIRDGHHRFEVARRLGIPVKFVICDDGATVYDLEKPTIKWSLKDYLDSYCREGSHPEYSVIKNFCQETGVAVSIAISLFTGHQAFSYTGISRFKDGNFKLDSKAKVASDVKDLMLVCKRFEIPFYNTAYLVQAFSKIVQVEEFKLSQMKSKIKSFHSLFEKKATVEQYLELLDDIYNRQSKAKIPLRFLANEAAKDRSPIKSSCGNV